MSSGKKHLRSISIRKFFNVNNEDYLKGGYNYGLYAETIGDR
jgi:hypothetical protein